MEIRTLGRTDLQVSSIGLGCVTFGRELNEAASFSVLDHARARGINLLDTAEVYAAGASESVVGKWLEARHCRREMVVATKVNGTLSAARIVSSAEASLQRLQIDTIDLFQLHRFDPTVPFEEMLEGLDQVVRKGYARYIGCSNWAAWQVGKALWQQDVRQWARMEAVQPMYNLVERGIEQELLPLCADQSIGVCSYSPLGAGFLTGKYRKDGPMPEGARFDRLPAHQPLYFHERGWRVLEGLRDLAQRSGISLAHLALSWTIGQPGITSVLIGARNIDQVDQAFEAEASGLSDALRAELNGL